MNQAAHEFEKYADDLLSQAEMFAGAGDSTPGAGMAATLAQVAGQMRERAAELRTEPDDDVVERVARAIFDTEKAQGKLGSLTWDSPRLVRERYREKARAAVRAMSGEGQ